MKAIIADKVKKITEDHVVFENGLKVYITGAPPKMDYMEIYCEGFYTKTGEHTYDIILQAKEVSEFTGIKNYGKIEGKIWKDFEYFEGNHEKRSFGAMIVETTNGFYRAVAINDMAEKIWREKECVEGAEVRVVGKVVNRKFIANHKEKSCLEVMIYKVDVKAY